MELPPPIVQAIGTELNMFTSAMKLHQIALLLVTALSMLMGTTVRLIGTLQRLETVLQVSMETTQIAL
jgi:hypothetical protein